MNYIVFDLEFNQDFSTADAGRSSRPCFEIIQIGAVKLDQNLNETETMTSYVKPTMYPAVNPFITELTGITNEQLDTAETFPGVYEEFSKFSGGSESIFCIWGMADLKELYRNIDYHKLDHRILSKRYINLQPAAALHFSLSPKKLLKLSTAAEMLGIPLIYKFHDALNDARYTAEILRNVGSETIRPKRYDPAHDAVRPRQTKQKIDFRELILQFEKMYARKLTDEEQSMVKLAYQMGKTRQFLK